MKVFLLPFFLRLLATASHSRLSSSLEEDFFNLLATVEPRDPLSLCDVLSEIRFPFCFLLSPAGERAATAAVLSEYREGQTRYPSAAAADLHCIGGARKAARSSRMYSFQEFGFCHV